MFYMNKSDQIDNQNEDISQFVLNDDKVFLCQRNKDDNYIVIIDMQEINSLLYNKLIVRLNRLKIQLEN